MAGQMTLMNEMRDIASIAADMASTDTSVRVRGAIDFLRLEARCDTFLLAYKTPGAKGFDLITSVGYSEPVARYLTSDIQAKPEFTKQFADQTRVWDWDDVPEFYDSYSGAEVLRPEGFTNGFLMVLHDGAGDVVGMCQGNMERPDFTPRNRSTVEAVRPLFTKYVTKLRTRARARLTPREQEILALLRSGLSNAEISDRLYLSPRTVSTHVERVLRKLGVANRVAAAVQATELELLDAGRDAVTPLP
ncbi:response regulator transcription factor [Mycolicibacterium smegmatis]|uniref:response regulator transcription factor n=1 Tax=Mycolicibacterium smegmatis TaxID=1772 RepID=UPI0005D9CB91|nr:response regulator transcription factor [Mycolicibacterium smegmatis]MDF1898973.1 response regulator transcription factor [Mycolicibacterium smegmatis]MDF1904797.1 response regulator transcription factor [Mycolicibacterium smegmatis]MDF1918666.1 response regulator transcription factor [Mycolicibacterium smegmatis]MDF1923961.1 response regulator transcription factor [Mycolicibacterium smegmatis]UGT78000.1 response regulator transcription factor [Mycolicibacterium smegmatis]